MTDNNFKVSDTTSAVQAPESQAQSPFTNTLTDAFGKAALNTVPVRETGGMDGATINISPLPGNGSFAGGKEQNLGAFRQEPYNGASLSAGPAEQALLQAPVDWPGQFAGGSLSKGPIDEAMLKPPADWHQPPAVPAPDHPFVKWLQPANPANDAGDGKATTVSHPSLTNPPPGWEQKSPKLPDPDDPNIDWIGSKGFLPHGPGKDSPAEDWMSGKNDQAKRVRPSSLDIEPKDTEIRYLKIPRITTINR